ncbi:MAG TPA: dihydrodipicolinate synthase family protein [Candidatus Dormibacteraeota bacterium]
MRLSDRAVHAMSITPFTAGGALDEALLRSHLRFLAGGGVGVFVCSQGSGEGDLLSAAEKLRIYEVSVETLHGVAPVCAAGIGLAGATAEIAALARGAAAAGVDAVYVLPPRPSPQTPRPAEIERYYRTVIEAVECPVILANNSFLAGYPLPLPLVVALAEAYPHVEAVLLVEANHAVLAQYVAALRGRARVLTGVVSGLLAAHAVGVAGVLCMEANVVPDLVPRLWDALQAGDLPAAEAAFRRLLELGAPIARHGNPRSLKDALALTGRDGGRLREPYLPLPPAERAELAESLRRLGLVAEA